MGIVGEDLPGVKPEEGIEGVDAGANDGGLEQVLGAEEQAFEEHSPFVPGVFDDEVNATALPVQTLPGAVHLLPALHGAREAPAEHDVDAPVVGVLVVEGALGGDEVFGEAEPLPAVPSEEALDLRDQGGAPGAIEQGFDDLCPSNLA